MRTFRPGDKVVCIEDSGWYRASNWTMLDKLRFMLTGKRPPVNGYPAHHREDCGDPKV